MRFSLHCLEQPRLCAADFDSVGTRTRDHLLACMIESGDITDHEHHGLDTFQASLFEDAFHLHSCSFKVFGRSSHQSYDEVDDRLRRRRRVSTAVSSLDGVEELFGTEDIEHTIDLGEECDTRLLAQFSRWQCDGRNCPEWLTIAQVDCGLPLQH